jgi:RNA polymerase sigma factor (sigma-70 family)
MPGDNTFADFIRQIRAGDAQAAEELVRRYEPVIRLEARLRLGSPQIRRLFDSIDICQSVLASFFVQAASGQYDLDQPQQLVGLLSAMARNKVAFQVRRQKAQKRGGRLVKVADREGSEAIAADESPSQLVVGQELLHEFRRRLTEEERHLWNLRSQGRSWAEIASDLGGTPETRRQQYSRAMDRVSRELRLNE